MEPVSDANYAGTADLLLSGKAEGFGVSALARSAGGESRASVARSPHPGPLKASSPKPGTSPSRTSNHHGRGRTHFAQDSRDLLLNTSYCIYLIMYCNDAANAISSSLMKLDAQRAAILRGTWCCRMEMYASSDTRS